MVDTRIYLVRAARAYYSTSTEKIVVLLCMCALFKP
jgi:hypothetical protein